MQVVDRELLVLDMECSNISVAQESEERPGTWTMEIGADAPQDSEAAMITSWQYSATMRLIETVCERMEELSSPWVKKMAVWQQVAKDLAAKGFCFSADQCDKKWRALKSRFKAVTKNTIRNGSGHKKWEFYDVLEKVLAEDPSVRPPVVISSRSSVKVHAAPIICDSGHDEPTPPNTPSNQTPAHTSTPDMEPEQTHSSLSDLEASQESHQPENVRRCGKRKWDSQDSCAPEWFTEFADKQLELLTGLKDSVDRRNMLLEKLVDSVQHLTKRTRLTPKASRRAQTLLKPKDLYTSRDVDNAMAAVWACQLSFGQASKKFCIPKSTLRDRVSGKVQDGKCGRRQDIPQEIEQAFVEKVLTAARSGFPVSKQTVLKNVGLLAKKMNLKTRFKNDMPSDMFWRGLKKRHPELAVHVDEVAPVSCTKLCKETLVKCSAGLKDLVSTLGLDEHPEAIWNCDEMAIPFMQEPSCAVAAKKGKQSESLLDPPNGENISVMACINAAGASMPPMITVKGRTPDNIHNFAMMEAPQDSLWVYQESGCVTDNVFTVWFSQMFLKHCGPRRPQILLLDSGDLEEKLDLVQLARDNNIRVMALPLHTVRVLHPLERSVFGPLKKHYNTERTSFLAETPHSSITEATWPGIFAKAWQKTLQESVIRQAFRSAGVFPCDRSVLQLDAFCQSKGLKGSKTTTTATHTITAPTPAVTTRTATAVTTVTRTADMSAPAVTVATMMSPVVTKAQTTEPSVTQDMVATPHVSSSPVMAAADSSPLSDGVADSVSDDELVAEPSMTLENCTLSPFLGTAAAGLAMPDFEEGLDMQTTTEVTVSTIPGKSGMKSKASRRTPALLESKKQYTPEDVEKAVAAVQACQLSFGQASKKFSIPKSTLMDRVSGRVQDGKCGRRQDIPLEVERAFVEKVLSAARSGSPMSKQTVLEKLGQLAKKMNLKTRFKNDLPSDMFWRGLKKRHPELAVHVA